MALLSGEVETGDRRTAGGSPCLRFRMALLSGEVETFSRVRSPLGFPSSGWLCYPGKLKLVWESQSNPTHGHSSGWLCYPGKLKRHQGHPHPHPPKGGSGWLCYPGKLKLCGTGRQNWGQKKFRMALLSGVVETTPGSNWQLALA